MSGFGGRTAPNVSQYIANLNAIPSAHDIATQQEDGLHLEDDLAIFTNAEFFDFDLGQNVDQSSINYDPSRRGNTSLHKAGKDFGFVNGDYQFPPIPTYANSHASPTLVHNFSPPNGPISSSYGSPTSPFDIKPHTGDKRKLDPTNLDSPDLEEGSRVAAEEDKRRRNTAASARFRVKKKQREQTLERTNKDLTDKATVLESRIGQLEMENQWLRTLVVEKTGRDDVGELWRKFSQETQEARSSAGVKKGVGTKIVESKAEDE
ncbi:hypothetical protein MMC12_003157 [Toensbergia leucococca]|nr:hypothetical protein [Toensbergia leucococca]